MNNDQISNILTMLLMISFVILMLLVVAAVIIKIRDVQRKKKIKDILNDKAENTDNRSIIEQNYDRQSIFNFMKFDKVEDNMIIQNNGTKFLMVVGCQGVNYDLMSSNEKIAVEQGFIQFLNTLKSPIQIYIQTRNVRLEKSISTYQKKINAYKDKLDRMKIEYRKMIESGNFTKEELDKYFFEITKQTNLYEYGKDILRNTEQMSQNKKVLNKKYYIVVPFYSMDIGNDKLDKEEIQNLSFSELYATAQSIVRTLSICGVKSKILNSEELTELLYIAYNRDEEEIYGLAKARKAGFEELYSTGQDVLDKQIKALDEKIEKDAIALANLKVFEAKSEKEKMIEKKEENLDLLISELAKTIVQKNKAYIGEDVSQMAIEKIEEQEQKNKDSKGGEKKNEKKAKTRVRKTK